MLPLCRRSYLLTALSVSLLAFGMAPDLIAADSPLKPHDRVVFLGDSITQAGDAPGGYVVLVREALAKIEILKPVEVIGAGVSGNKVPDLEARLDKDVLSFKPSIVVVYIGINDVWHSKSGRGTKKEEFDAGLRRIVKRINEAGARVILCTPSVIGEKVDGTNPLDEMLEEYCVLSRKVAADTKSQLLDLRKLFIETLKKTNLQNLEKNTLTSDGVHLNPAGNRFVAEAMLSALGTSAAPTTTGRKLRHFVVFKFKDEVKPEEVQEVARAFAALPSKINTIIEFEKGTDVSVEMKADGFTHAFLVTFADETGRETYLPHPAHLDFIKLAGPRIDKVFVFDYWTK